MREIKFRGWNKQSKIMVDDIRIFTPQDTYNLNDAFDNEMIVLPLQFTGLRDKNGKEIYEGDIVEVDLQDSGYYDVINSKVEYDNENMRWVINGYGVVNDKWSVGVFCKVIGNIYENPEEMK